MITKTLPATYFFAKKVLKIIKSMIFMSNVINTSCQNLTKFNFEKILG